MLSHEPGKPTRHVVWSLGANIGDPLANLSDAVRVLGATPGVTVTAVSPVYATAPVGNVVQPDFLNVVALGHSDLPPLVLLERCQSIEDLLGRVRTERWGPRTVDVDIILLGDLVSDDERLTLPHPRAHERAFVLVPWLAVDADAVLPGRGPVAALVDDLDAAGVRRLDDVSLRLR